MSESPNNGSGIGSTEDDISLLWLINSVAVPQAVSLLEANGNQVGMGQIFYGASLTTMFNKPGLPPNGDPRTPDIIVQPNVGVIYTSSSKKQEEHGGFAHDDTNVMMLFSNPSFKPNYVNAPVDDHAGRADDPARAGTRSHCVAVGADGRHAGAAGRAVLARSLPKQQCASTLQRGGASFCVPNMFDSLGVKVPCPTWWR